MMPREMLGVWVTSMMRQTLLMFGSYSNLNKRKQRSPMTLHVVVANPRSVSIILDE